MLFAYAFLALAIGWAYSSLRIRMDQEQTLNTERNRLRAVAAALHTGAHAMISEGIGAAMAGANAALGHDSHHDGASGDALPVALSKMLTGGEYIRALFIVDGGRFAQAGRSGLRDASTAPHWFTAPRDAPSDATWVGRPIADPDRVGEYVIPLARRLVTTSGDEVWAGVHFGFAAFEDLYRRFGEDLRVMGMVATDGTVLAIVPRGIGGVTEGMSVAGNKLFQRARRHPGAGVVEGYGVGLHTDMLFGYERVSDYPMTILAGQTRDNTLAPWRDRRRTTLMVTGASSALILLLTGVLSHSVSARRRLDMEREQALADLRKTTGELMRLQDEERRRIGRDLHDSTGQALAALELGLTRLKSSAAGTESPQRREALEQCARLASQCSAEIRTASYLLHPPLLDELGLTSALRWLADGLRERSGIDVQLDLPDSMDRLPRETELTLFRVAQEALTNVHRHSDSPSVLIRLTRRADSVLLEIEDVGRGFSAEERARASAGADGALGVGLAGMRERIRQVGGRFMIDADSGGTAIRAALPIPRTRAAESVSA